ncbi:MAG: M48 family metalloprotease [Thermodesulfobacteriota bacterium]
MLLTLLTLLPLLHSCATNPVTGKRELTLLSESAEISMGEENYLFSRQSQGGDYVVEPELTAYVADVGARIARVSDRPHLPYEFVVLNSSVPNAWALPGGKIAVNRGLLLELSSEAELAAVLAHEIVHVAARHGAKGIERGIALQAGMIGVGLAASDSSYSDIAVGAASIGTALISKRYSRGAELEADHYGMKYMAKAGYDPAAAIALQQTFVRLSSQRRSNWLSGLFASHPPSQERVEANVAMASQLPQGGRVGRKEYQARIGGLERTRAAYEAHDRGRTLLADGNVAEALSLVERAIAVESGEALFYGLRGDGRVKQRRYRAALADYDAAIERNSGFYQFFLQRGLVRQELGNIEAADKDLQKSAALFPTAHAYNGLGLIAVAGGQRQRAIAYFGMAASSNSEVSRRARVSLARLELPERPERYLSLQLQRDRRGYVVVLLDNKSPVTVRDVVVAVRRLNDQGRIIGTDTVSFRHAIGPRRRSGAVTHIGPLSDESALQHIRLKILYVTVVD